MSKIKGIRVRNPSNRKRVFDFGSVEAFGHETFPDSPALAEAIKKRYLLVVTDTDHANAGPATAVSDSSVQSIAQPTAPTSPEAEIPGGSGGYVGDFPKFKKRKRK